MTPTATITSRSAAGDSRRPQRAPITAAEHRADGDQPDGAHATCAANAKITPETRLTRPREDDLERVDPLQVVVEREPEDREQHDPLRGAEVAAVDPAANTATSVGTVRLRRPVAAS